MATVFLPKYGVKVKYKNGVETTMWRSTERERDKLHAQLNNPKRNPDVSRATRVQRSA